MKLYLVAIISIVLVSSAIAWSYVTAGCSTDFEFRKSRVILHLNEVGLPVKYLSLDSKGSTDCKTSFNYNSATENINFVVIDGGKVKWWDYNERDD